MSEEEVNKIIEVYDSVIADLKQENNQLRKRIDKTVQAIDELLIYSDFNDTTNGFGNVKEELKFYLSDCKTMTEFKMKDLLKGDKE